MLDLKKIAPQNYGNCDATKQFERNQTAIAESPIYSDIDKNICELFEEQVIQHPDTAAAVEANRQITYGELHQKSNQLANYLRKMGVQPNILVGLSMASDIEFLIALLGILKAGGVYLPLDPHYPQERLRLMLENAKPAILLTQSRWADLFLFFQNTTILLDEHEKEIALTESDQTPSSAIQPDHLAYVIYTSGSTGQPKGIMVTHGCFPQIALAHRGYYPANLRGLLTGAISFDPTILMIFHVMISGGTICLPNFGPVIDPENVIRFIQEKEVNFLLCVPSFYSMLLQRSNSLPSLKIVSLAGEAIPNDLPHSHSRLAPDALLYNEYGPSEYAIGTTIAKIYDPIEKKVNKVTIGKPLPQTQVYILDSDLQLLLDGVKGEILIGGVGLARGYLNNPILTAEKFIWVNLPEQEPICLYRTGDYGRLLQSGDIEFLGRMDYQVKIRGHRIELGEIEHTICQFQGVNEAVVVVRGEEEDYRRLIAYYSTSSSSSIQEGLQTYLKTRLPKAMLPSAYIELAHFPRTPNGKIDRNALPDQHKTTKVNKDLPQSEMQQILLAIWEQILKQNSIGIHDPFFDLGGDSLELTHVQIAIEEKLHLHIPIVDLLQHPTISQLAHFLTGCIERTMTTVHSQADKRKAVFQQFRKRQEFSL